jgi:hypothetical protein
MVLSLFLVLFLTLALILTLFTKVKMRVRVRVSRTTSGSRRKYLCSSLPHFHRYFENVDSTNVAGLRWGRQNVGVTIQSFSSFPPSVYLARVVTKTYTQGGREGGREGGSEGKKERREKSPTTHGVTEEFFCCRTNPSQFLIH